MARVLLGTIGLLVFLLLVALVGQLYLDRERAAHSRAIVEVVGTYPGATPQVVDDLLTKLVLWQLRGCEGAEKITAISTDGRSEIYVAGRAGFDGKELSDLLSRRESLVFLQLPAGVKLERPELLSSGSKVPIVQPRPVDQAMVQIDRAKCAQLGILLSDVSDALDHIPTAQLAGPKGDFAGATVNSQSGDTIALRDIATIEMGKAPDAIVHADP